MKSRIFSILAIALILFTSLTFVGCGGGGSTKVTVSNCAASPASIYVGETTTISADLSNAGATGTYTATCKVGDTTISTKTVDVASKTVSKVSFTYTATAKGTFTISIGTATGTLGVLEKAGNGSTNDYWDVKYNVVGGKVTLNYSLAKATAYRKDLTLTRGDGVVTIRVSKTVVDGARAVTLPKEGWQIKGIQVDDISPGVGMFVTFSLGTDATGTLYVQDGVGNVDMSSVSSTGREPIQANTLATGNKAPAGSMLVPTALVGLAKVSVGTDVSLDFGLIFTTGHIVNTVSLAKSKFDKATLASDGVAFAKTGTLSPADYVGTAGTITTTGTGSCLGLTLVGFPIDFQAEIQLVLEPESVN